MADQFDAHKEAEKIAGLDKGYMDDPKSDAGQKLQEELVQLQQTNRARPRRQGEKLRLTGLLTLAA